MSDEARTIEEYVEQYARDYCGGDIEKAKEHIMVKLVEHEKRGISCLVLKRGD